MVEDSKQLALQAAFTIRTVGVWSPSGENFYSIKNYDNRRQHKIDI
jgi:hypothetical protein